MPATRKRTITTTEEIVEHAPPEVRIKVSIGALTLGQVKAMAGIIERAAAEANAPTTAEIEIDTYGGESVATIRWVLS